MDSNIKIVSFIFVLSSIIFSGKLKKELEIKDKGFTDFSSSEEDEEKEKEKEIDNIVGKSPEKKDDDDESSPPSTEKG